MSTTRVFGLILVRRRFGDVDPNRKPTNDTRRPFVLLARSSRGRSPRRRYVRVCVCIYLFTHADVLVVQAHDGVGFFLDRPPPVRFFRPDRFSRIQNKRSSRTRPKKITPGRASSVSANNRTVSGIN